MNLELRHYRYFVTLAETLHFGRAAELLGISQPALSQQLRVIEQAVGVPLLTRAGRRLGLTEVGGVFRDEAVAVLRQVERSETATARASRGDTGALSIGYVASAALSGLLPHLIVAFRHAHPDVQVSIREMDMPAQIVAVAEGELDIGFVRPPVRDLLDGVALQMLEAEPVVAVLNVKHRLARRARIDVAALREETFICTHTQEGTGFYATTLEICAAAGFRPHVQALSRQMSTIISMVAAGFGVALIPASMTRFAQPDVAFRPLVQNDVVSYLALAHRKSIHSPAVQQMIRLCRRR
ncbi:LysR family transcriptional regulator [Burkholderia orbicola]|uniref:LysR family transcriptional regulator n=1 Tax=Burkholderia orbicola TaxID=2978683 RepID=UPI0035C76E2F